jgi:4-hydroxy-3-polyprenylbenzoate decarboxylase
MNRLRDLREYIAALKAIGELQEINKEVDRNLEIGAIVRRSYDLRAAVPLYNSIRGVKRGFRVLGAPGGLGAQQNLMLCRVGVSLGLDNSTKGHDIVNAIACTFRRPGIPPRTVETAPCKEVITKASHVDLTRLPSCRRTLVPFATKLSGAGPTRRFGIRNDHGKGFYEKHFCSACDASHSLGA